MLPESDLPTTREALLREIDRGWDELHRVLGPLDDETLTRGEPGPGWAVKDHLMHLAMWERGVRYLLERKLRYEGMGITETEWRSLSMDEINELIYERNRERPLSEVRLYFEGSHIELLNVIATLEDDDLLRPYHYFQPAEPVETNGRPVVSWIVGNTYEHYREHMGYVQELLNR